MIQPPVDSVGINIQHHYHIVDGLIVTGGTQGIKMGPHHREDWIVGVVAQNNEVYGNSGNGIELRRAIDGVVAFNTAYANGGSGLKYSGQRSLIHDNVASANAGFGVYVRDGGTPQVHNNRAYDNGKGNLKIVSVPVKPSEKPTLHSAKDEHAIIRVARGVLDVNGDFSLSGKTAGQRMMLSGGQGNQHRYSAGSMT
jgi:parallel beta-helix repeat protein